MRIITGIAKGCKLKAPKGLVTRPTADRVKESLFSIIQNKIYASNVLDIFAGSGNLGLDALSRGANKAFFVDQSLDSMRVIKDNAEHTKLIEQCNIYKMDVFSALRKFMNMDLRFDLVFCDPPYNKGLSEKVLVILDELEILSNEALVIIEHSREDKLIENLKYLNLKKQQKYGTTIISIYQYNK